jgi:hypothetical protein
MGYKSMHVTEMDEPPTIQDVIESMLKAGTDSAVLIARGTKMDIAFKIEIVEVNEKC